MARVLCLNLFGLVLDMQEGIVNLLSTIVILFPAAFHSSYDTVSSIRFSDGDLVLSCCFIEFIWNDIPCRLKKLLPLKYFLRKPVVVY